MATVLAAALVVALALVLAMSMSAVVVTASDRGDASETDVAVASVLAVAVAVAMAMVAATHHASESRPPRWIDVCRASSWRAVEMVWVRGRVKVAIPGGIRTRVASDT